LAVLARSSRPVHERASAPPESYTPRHLAQRILASRDALEGERKQVTVLFADIKGSTELIDGLDPEDGRRLLEPAVRAMIEAVHRFEGTVCRVMGDGIMALFGAPLAHEDHAARACYAALSMQATIHQYGQETRERDGVEVLARVGLNSGEVVVGSISNDLYVEYSAIGPTTHLAARMEQLAREGTVRLTAETLRLVEGLVDVKPLGRIPVKGVSAPVEAFELIGATAGRGRFQAAATRGLTPFVGRQAELAALQQSLDLARAGHGQIVAPVGEPGVGKSRLFHEFVHSHRTAGWLVLESGSVSYGRATPGLPVIELLRSYCRIEPRDDARTAREKLIGKLLGLDRMLETILPPLLALLDLPVEDASASPSRAEISATPTSGPGAWATLDPPERRLATLDALSRLLLRESQRQPLLLVFEDLHWIDAETQALLDILVESLAAARMLLLVNYRPEYSHTWGNKSCYIQLRIDPLGQASAEELLTALLGDDPSVESLKPLLIGRTDGNPFFLEESVRALVETGGLAGERGAYLLTRPAESLRVPATVQAVLAARIDRLPPEEKRLLQTASVIGKDVPFALLQRIADAPEDDLQVGLSHLQAAELLYAVSLFPDLEYTFKHALTHEVAYSSLLQERRKALHARIVAAIEQLYPDRLEEHVERLAHHALRGERWEQALDYCRRAGARAVARLAEAEAAGLFEQALQALEQLPPSPARVPLAIDLRFDLRTVLFSLGEYGRAHEQALLAEALAEQAGDRARLGRALTYQAHHLRATVDHRRAVEVGERAIAIGVELGDPGLQIAAADVAGTSSFEMGAFPRAIAILRANVARLSRDLPQELLGQHVAPAVMSRGYLALSLAWQGEFKEAAYHVEEAIQIAELMQHERTAISAGFTSGLVYSVQGALARAIPRLQRAEAIATKVGRPGSGGLLVCLGRAYTLAGRPEEGIPALEGALEDYDRRGWLPCVSFWTGALAGAYLGAGRLVEAEQTGVRAVEMARAHQEHGFEADALCQLSAVVAGTEPLDAARAEGHFREALAIAEELGMRPVQAHCHLGLGKLYRRLGRAHEARSELNVAIDLYLSMAMTHWLPEAEAELAALKT
jgi:class 3 adenylate cyclase/tetratricopeptide (TPR) repeat protein